jgi:hypothetical protein
MQSDKYYLDVHGRGCCFIATMHVLLFITDVAAASLGSEVTALRAQLIDQVTPSLNCRRRAFERLKSRDGVTIDPGTRIFSGAVAR